MDLEHSKILCAVLHELSMASVIMHGVLVKEKRLSNSSGETSFADMRSIIPAFDFKFVVFKTFALS